MKNILLQSYNIQIPTLLDTPVFWEKLKPNLLAINAQDQKAVEAVQKDFLNSQVFIQALLEYSRCARKQNLKELLCFLGDNQGITEKLLNHTMTLMECKHDIVHKMDGFLT